ncbi:MAG: ankyrin repeat domain-containing protein [Candidatus Micrarchaeia archaeon]
MDIQNKPLANVESLKKDDAKKSKILREIKRIAGITLLSASIMLTTNCATNKALMYAARDGRTEIVKLLLEKGADVNAKDILGLTALRYAAENGHKDVVELLKKAGGH